VRLIDAPAMALPEDPAEISRFVARVLGRDTEEFAMTNLAVQPAFDAEAYLAWEERQEEKHEFIAGEVFAMAGARREHVVVSGNLYAVFKQRLRGGPCQAYVADLRVRVDAADAFFYPDVVVSCDPRDHAADQFIAHPTLIVEVLSESTAAFDRGKKFAAYRTLPSLQEYVLVDIEARRVETFRRTPENDWLLHEYLPDCGECRFPTVNVSIPFDEIFENVIPQAA
jgi:Uma2 family endonuclease